MRLRSLVKTTAIPVVHHMGLIRALDRCAGSGGVVALSYHRVEPTVFEAHARFLSRRCRVVDVADLGGECGSEGTDDRLRVVLTFDDGYASFAHDIVPILKRHGLPADWFVVTEHVGSESGFWFDRVQSAIEGAPVQEISLGDRVWALPARGREFVAYEIKAHMKDADPGLLAGLEEEVLRQTGPPPTGAVEARRLATEEEIRAVDGDGIRVGSHSKSHRNLSSLDDDGLDEELRGSRCKLEAMLGREVDRLAFPSGDYDDRVVARAHDAGYRWAFTTEPRFVQAGDLPLRIPRVIIDDRASVAVLAARISPWMHGKGAIR